MAARQNGRLAGARLPWLLVVLSLLATAAWAFPVVLSRGHGFDVSDEGSYVLSYRWWDSNARNFTGSQYIYGPVFEAVGYSIAWLRLVRLVSLLVAHAVFGWAFMSWLRARFPPAVPSRAWVVAGIAALVAAGGVTYGWLPLSPGYDDLVVLGCLGVMTVYFRSWRGVLLDGRLPIAPVLVLPLPVLGMALAKWSSAVAVLVFLGVSFVLVALALRPAGGRRFVAAGLGSTAVMVVLFDLVVAPLATVVPPLVEVNRLVAGSTHDPGALLEFYISSTREILGQTTTLLALVAVLGLVGAGLARTRMRLAARWVAAAGPILVIGVVAAPGESPWPEGGDAALADYSAGLVALVLATAGALGVAIGRAGRGHWAAWGHLRWDVPVVLATLLLLPGVQAVGSGNSLYSLAVNLAAVWLACIFLCVVVTSPAAGTRWFAVASAIATLVLCVSVGADGVLLHPYRTTAYDSSNRALGGEGGALSEIALGPTEVAELEAVRRAMTATPSGRRPVIALDEIGGLLLLTEGRSLGESWTSAVAPERLAAGIHAACEADSWSEAREPVVLAWRPVRASVSDALTACGARLDGGSYRELRLPFGDRSVRVFTPRD